MPNQQDLEPLLATQQNHVGHLIDVGDSIDTKALAILATNVALLIFIAQSNLHGVLVWLLLYIPLGISLVLDTIAIWPRRYDSVGVDLQTYPDYLTMDYDTLVKQLLADAERAITRNNRLNARRMRHCIASILLSVLGTVALFVMLQV